jgi:hypothetical protein
MFHTLSHVYFCVLYDHSRNGNNSLLWAVMQGLSKMFGQCSGMSSPQQNKEQLSCQYLSANTVFKVQLPRSPRLTHLDFHLCRQLQPYFIQLQLKMKRYFTNAFFAYKTIHNIPGTFERVRHSISKCVHSWLHSDGAYLELFFLLV